jgi:hypothetical protein
MKETDCQQLVIDAVKETGGAGLKFNNRFLIGVCDLLIQAPDLRPMFLEAKKRELADGTEGHVWELDVTHKQKSFLGQWHKAGMLTGVVSFIQTTDQDVRSLKMCVYSYVNMLELDWRVKQAHHFELGEKDQRLGRVRTILKMFQEHN